MSESLQVTEELDSRPDSSRVRALGGRAFRGRAVEASLPPEVVDGLRVTHLALLATASRDARPTTTLVSWLWPVDPTRLLFALDRRGLAFKNLIENPFAALEILIGQFAGAARGTVTILPECLMTPFPCSVALLQLAEVRRHDVDGVIVLPPRYEFAGDKQHYARTDGAIVDQLAEIAIRIEAGQD